MIIALIILFNNNKNTASELHRYSFLELIFCHFGFVSCSLPAVFIMTRYCLLHGDIYNQNALRHWDIMGKLDSDADPWVILKHHTDNDKLAGDCLTIE